jgi:hypothetical protein
MPVLKMLAQFASVQGVLYLPRFENEAIVCAKTTNEYFQYLLKPWDYIHTKSTGRQIYLLWFSISKRN